MIALDAFITIEECIGFGADALCLLVIINSSSCAVYAVILSHVPVSRNCARDAFLTHELRFIKRTWRTGPDIDIVDLVLGAV